MKDLYDPSKLLPFVDRAVEMRRVHEKDREKIILYLRGLGIPKILDRCSFQESAIHFLEVLWHQDLFGISSSLRLICNLDVPVELHDNPGKLAVTISQSGVVQINVLCEAIEIANGLGIN